MGRPDFEREIARQFGLDGVLADAVEEYGRFRAGFENGVLPDMARSAPDPDAVKGYIRTLTLELQRSVTETWRIEVAGRYKADRALRFVDARFVRNEGVGEAPSSPPDDVRPDGPAIWLHGSGLTYDARLRRATLAKADQACRRTLEQAVADGRRILAHIAGGRAAA